MILDITHADLKISLRNRCEDIYRSTVGCCSQVLNVIYVGVDTLNGFEDLVADHVAHAFFSMAAVASECEDNSYVLVFDPCFVKLVENMRDDLVTRHRSCDVGCNDGDLLAGLDHILETRCSDRCLK